MYRFHRTADMLSDVSRLLAFAADELRDCARAASVADDRACAAIDQADMLDRQLQRLLGQRPELAPTPGPLPMPECRDEGCPPPTASHDAPEGLPAAEPAPAADIPPLDAAPAPSPGAGTRTRRGRARKGEGDGEGQAPAPAPDAATDVEAREQVAQVLGDPPVVAPAPATPAQPRDVSADLFGAPADGEDLPPL